MRKQPTYLEVLGFGHEMPQTAKSNVPFAGALDFQSAETHLFGACPIGMAFCREGDGLFLEANLAMGALIGLPPAQLIGQTDLDLDFWESEPLKSRGLAGLAETLPLSNMDMRVRSNGGEMRTVLLSIERMPGGSHPAPDGAGSGILLVCAH